MITVTAIRQVMSSKPATTDTIGTVKLQPIMVHRIINSKYFILFYLPQLEFPGGGGGGGVGGAAAVEAAEAYVAVASAAVHHLDQTVVS
uniref:Uncharacterized protein n=1 Tax=Plectus sambesii TaxID=2011161 RepID=A0A914VL72_9BILA